MKKRILLVFWFKNFLNYFWDLIKNLKLKEDIELFLISENEELINDFKTFFPPFKAWQGYDPEILNKVEPHLIICLNELWLPRVIPLFIEARSRNIPIVTYDHGTHYCKSYYLLQKDEYTNRYRGDTALCSHIVCWGQHGKENWGSFGVPDKKMAVIGGLQYDSLYRPLSTKKEIYEKLKISRDKKIILLFTCLMHKDSDEPSKTRTIEVIKQLENYIRCHDEYILVVKPHPIEFTLSNHCSFPYKCNPIIISNPQEHHWEEAREIEVNQVIAHSFAVVSTHSSVLVAPLILNIPIIYIDVSIPKSKDFQLFGQNAFITLKEDERIDPILQNLDQIYTKKRQKESAHLAAQLNYNNDGQAVKRFEALLDKIIKEQKSGKYFYIPIEDEYLENQRQFPGLPYPYQNLILWYGSQGNHEKALEWYAVYSEKFHQPIKIFEILWSTFFKGKRTLNNIEEFIDTTMKKRLVTLEHIYRASLMQERLGCFENAEYLLNKVLTSGPYQVLLKKCLYEKGILASKKDDFAEAIPFYQKILEIETDEKDIELFRIYFRLGEAYFKTKRTGKAHIYLNECIKICPGHNAASDLLNRLNLEK